MNLGNETEDDKMDIASKATSPSFKVRMVNDKKVAGYYAVYLIDHLDAETGHYTDYSSFARELLDETGWFESERHVWYVEDESFKIHLTVTHSYDDDTEENVQDEDTTMRDYWSETQLYDSGLEEDYFAGEYEQVYRGANIGWDDDRDGMGDEEEGQRSLVRIDYYVQGIGDEETVTHPVSGGSLRIQL